MTKPNSSKAIEELIASVRSNVDVIRDAMKGPATDESHAVVSDLMLDLKQSQEKLQKKAGEMAESGQFDSTNVIFEAIDQVSHLEPEFEAWSKSGHGPESAQADTIGASIHVEADTSREKKKKKKSKKSKKESEFDPGSATPPEAGGWDAFPPPPGMVSAPVVSSAVASGGSGGGWPAPPSAPGAANQSVTFAKSPPEIISETDTAAAARLNLGMTWDVIGPLLGDPGSSEDARRHRLAELMTEAIAAECNISPNRIRIKQIS